MRDYRKRRALASSNALLWTPSAVVFPTVERRVIPVGMEAALAIRAWAKSELRVPAGLLQGHPFELPDFQVAWLGEALEVGVLEAGLSMARKNGKTGLISVLMLSCLVGPLQQINWRGIVASMDGGLAKELSRQVEEIAIASWGTEQTKAVVLATPSPGRIKSVSGEVTLLAADKSSGHAVGADIAVIDEAGLLQANKRDLWNGIRTAVSGRKGGRFLAISIQSDGLMFAEMRENSVDSSVVFHEYAAGADDDISDPATWRKGNPGLDSGIKSLDYMRSRARLAVLTPDDLASFRVYELNQKASAGAGELLLDVSDWTPCEVMELPVRMGSCYVGFDLGGSASMTAAVAYWPQSGRFETWAAFPEVPTLKKRGEIDGVGTLYERAHDEGQLLTCGRRVVDVWEFLKLVWSDLDGSDITELGSDRFRFAEALQAFEGAGIETPIRWRGTGASATADGSYDIRAFRRAAINGKLKVLPLPLMRSALRFVKLRHDGAGNPALDKTKPSARIDLCQSGVIAVGLATLANSPDDHGDDW